MEDISGSLVVRAFCAMGHRMVVQTETDEARRMQHVRTSYYPPGTNTVGRVEIDISLDALMRTRKPENLIADAVGDAIEHLVSEQLRRDVLRVMQAMKRGPLGAELIGGPRDGEHIAGLQTGRDGWPVPVLYLPMPTLHQAPFTDWDDLPVFEPTHDVVTYERDFVSPVTLHWRYLARKGSS